MHDYEIRKENVLITFTIGNKGTRKMTQSNGMCRSPPSQVCFSEADQVMSLLGKSFYEVLPFANVRINYVHVHRYA